MTERQQAAASAAPLNGLLVLAGAHGDRLDRIEDALGRLVRALEAQSKRIAELEAARPAAPDTDVAQ